MPNTVEQFFTDANTLCREHGFHMTLYGRELIREHDSQGNYYMVCPALDVFPLLSEDTKIKLLKFMDAFHNLARMSGISLHSDDEILMIHIREWPNQDNYAAICGILMYYGIRVIQ